MSTPSDLMNLLHYAERRAVVDGREYYAASVVLECGQDVPGGLRVYCPADGWADTVAGRLAARDAEIARLQEQLRRLPPPPVVVLPDGEYVICTRCRTPKPVTEFYSRQTAAGGQTYAQPCRACHAKANTRPARWTLTDPCPHCGARGRDGAESWVSLSQRSGHVSACVRRLQTDPKPPKLPKPPRPVRPPPPPKPPRTIVCKECGEAKAPDAFGLKSRGAGHVRREQPCLACRPSVTDPCPTCGQRGADSSGRWRSVQQRGKHIATCTGTPPKPAAPTPAEPAREVTVERTPKAPKVARPKTTSPAAGVARPPLPAPPPA